MIDLEILEAHGLAASNGDMRVGVREDGGGRMHLETKSVSGVRLTSTEARFLASRLLRLAWRLDARAAQTQPEPAP